MTGPQFEALLERIQSDEGVRGEVESRCQPTVDALLEQPLRELGDDP